MVRASGFGHHARLVLDHSPSAEPGRAEFHEGVPDRAPNFANVPPTVLTTGYEQHPGTESLVSRLRGAGVKVLVDVRELPLSWERSPSI